MLEYYLFGLWGYFLSIIILVEVNLGYFFLEVEMRLKELMKIANKLDSLGLTAEADILDKFMRKVAQELSDLPSQPGYATHGYPGGDASKRMQGFLYSSPRDLAEFNNQLAELFEFVPETSQVVPVSVLRALPYGETTWGDKTQAAFAAFCSLVGAGAASKDWESYANQNQYEPTIAGVFKFWDENKKKANTLISSDLISRQKPATPSGGYSAPEEDWKSGMINYNDEKGRGGPAVHPDFKRKLVATVSGGAGMSGAFGVGTTTYTQQIMNMINGNCIGAKQWFALDPKVTLPWTLKFPLTKSNIDLYLSNNNIINREIKKIYGMMLQANEESNNNRDAVKKQQSVSEDYHS